MGFKKVPHDVDDKIFQLRAKGMGVVAIAAALKIGKTTVAERLEGIGYAYDLRRARKPKASR